MLARQPSVVPLEMNNPPRMMSPNRDDSTEVVETNPKAVEESNPSTTVLMPPRKTNKGDTWTVMLYQDATIRFGGGYLYVLNEAERIGSTDKVNMVAQIDRYKGGFKGKQNFTGA
jgi:hypothetical protein